MRPADYLGIKDRSIAFYFDVECTEALIEFENELEISRLEAMSGGALTRPFGGALDSGSRQLPEINHDNFPDYG